jgi:hypothetical protein
MILYRDGDDWRHEKDAAARHFECTSTRTCAGGKTVIARFSALPFYRELERDLGLLGSVMINTYDAHRYLADIGTWYRDLYDLTPKTWDRLEILPDVGPFVLKGETNSKKFLWDTHMFAPTKADAIRVHSRLTEDSVIQYQKIYIREYVELDKLGQGFRGLPITREYRFFAYKRRILCGGYYWSTHTDELPHMCPSEVPEDLLSEIMNRVQSTTLATPPVFYAIDVAKTASGDWILVELNDGQMSGLSDNYPDVLYTNLRDAIEKDGEV